MRKDPKKDKFSFKRRIESFEYAFKGIRSFFFTTHNAWVHLAITVLVIFFAILFQISVVEWIAIIFAIGMVFTAEAFNTAIEEYVDMVQPEYDKKAGNIKDISAGAVLLSAISAAIIGILIFFPRFKELFAL